MWFLYVEWQTRRVPDTRPKPDGYGYMYEFLPTGKGTDINFYPQHLFWRTDNYSTWSQSNPLSSLLLLYYWYLCSLSRTLSLIDRQREKVPRGLLLPRRRPATNSGAAYNSCRFGLGHTPSVSTSLWLHLFLQQGGTEVCHNLTLRQNTGIEVWQPGRYDPLFLSWFLFSNVIEY
jgi:hypothetical protein